MSTEQTWQTESTSLEDTLELAVRIGHNVKGGEIIDLQSDLGGGKTAFVRGLAKGMGSQDTVRSPSFSLAHEYKAGALKLQHLDFYRLNEPGIMREQVAEAINDPQSVVAIEWSGIVEDVLPDDRLTVKIRVTSETGRQFTFEYPKKLNYLMPADI